MSKDNIEWEVKKDYISKLAADGLRQDKRKMDEYRKIELTPNYIPHALGSARVKLGTTEVVVGVSLKVGTPYPDSPASGTLMTGAEFSPIANSMFELGPPRPNAIELARVVDRGIRESGAIDFSKLCIEEGEAVWTVMVDMHMLDHGGNLFDASALAAISALLNTRMPKYEDGRLIRDEIAGKLPVEKKPIECTAVKIGDTIMLDPSFDEECSLDARLTIATTEKSMCAMQKGGIGAFTLKEVEDMLDLSFKKGKELRKLL